jgi:ATP-dependent DNA helicase RecG
MQEALSTPVHLVKHIGPARAARLERLGVRTLRDALWLAPRRYEDRRSFQPLGRLRPGVFATVRGRVKAVGTGRTRRGIPYCELLVTDETGTLTVRWYRQLYLARTFRPGQQLVLSGRLSPHPPREMVNPEHEAEDEGDARYHAGRIVPIYPLTAGIGQRFLRRWLADLAARHAPALVDPLPAPVRERHRLLSLPEAIHKLHLPGELPDGDAARRRLVFEEFFLFSLAILGRRAAWVGQPGIAFEAPGPLAAGVRAALPFVLTTGQERVLAEIYRDMRAPRPMHRLLQGDVGSGKTIVAVLAALAAVGNGYQAAIMAPTEVLASQHAERMGALVAPLGVRVVHLAGGLTPKARREAQASLADPGPCLVIGTHALLQPDVQFGRLGFVVVDEQHRFGVLQRAALQQKGLQPDVLVMSATPIPRSLALVLYGDLDLSLLDESPPGRKPPTTHWLDEGARAEIQAELERRLAAGERCYVICPVVEESAAELKSAVQTAQAYRRERLGRFGVGLVHGRLPAAEKQETLRAFREGRVGILVATTVVEVGVDIPEATAMVIEHADRLGLAQLHQLRGRVARSERSGVCFLLADPSEVTAEAQARLEALVREANGFALAEADLRLRGPGEFFGTRQAGLDGFQFADLLTDPSLLEAARAEAAGVLAAHPALDGPWGAVRALLQERWTSRLGLARVG